MNRYTFPHSTHRYCSSAAACFVCWSWLLRSWSARARLRRLCCSTFSSGARRTDTLGIPSSLYFRSRLPFRVFVVGSTLVESWSRRGVCAGSWLVEVGVWRWSWRCGLRWSRSSTADRAAGTRGAGDGVGLGDWSGCGIFVRHDSCRCVRALASLWRASDTRQIERSTRRHTARGDRTRDSTCLAWYRDSDSAPSDNSQLHLKAHTIREFIS